MLHLHIYTHEGPIVQATSYVLLHRGSIMDDMINWTVY